MRARPRPSWKMRPSLVCDDQGSLAQRSSAQPWRWTRITDGGAVVKALDLFSCIGCHAIGFERAGIETKALCEISPWRRSILSNRFPKAELYGAIELCPNVPA